MPANITNPKRNRYAFKLSLISLPPLISNYFKENYKDIVADKIAWSGNADLTPSSLAIWVNISEPICLARFFHCLVFQ